MSEGTRDLCLVSALVSALVSVNQGVGSVIGAGTARSLSVSQFFSSRLDGVAYCGILLFQNGSKGIYVIVLL